MDGHVSGSGHPERRFHTWYDNGRDAGVVCRFTCGLIGDISVSTNAPAAENRFVERGFMIKLIFFISELIINSVINDRNN